MFGLTLIRTSELTKLRHEHVRLQVDVVTLLNRDGVTDEGIENVRRRHAERVTAGMGQCVR